MVRLIAGLNVLGLFTTEAFLLPNNIFLSCAIGLQLFEMNISYGFGNIKAINLLCQQPSSQLIVTLTEVQQYGALNAVMQLKYMIE